MKVLYDKNREMNLVKLHDGLGNIYVLNIPPDCKLTPEAILTNGELISMKLVGQRWMRIDSSSDPYFRKYAFLDPIQALPEHDNLIMERRKKAPVPGDETPHGSMLPEVPVGPPPSKSGRKLGPKTEFIMPKGAEFIQGYQFFKFYKLNGDFYFKGQKINGTVVENTIPCKLCEAVIKFHANVTFRDEKPFFVSANTPYEKAKPLKPRSPFWVCEKCLKGEAEKPAVEEQQPEETVLEVTEPETPAEELPETVTPPETPPAVPEKPAKKEFAATLIPTTASGLSIFKKLEDMAMDADINDKMFRGAAWMLARTLGGAK